MSKRKKETVPTPSESTRELLLPARGISDINSPTLMEVAQQLLALPPQEQIAAAYWMGTQPEYNGLLGYLLAQVGVMGELRRAVKRSIFALRRVGVHIKTEMSVTEPQKARTAQRWQVQQVYAAVPSLSNGEFAYVQLRFFLHEPPDSRAVFIIDLSNIGAIADAILKEEGVQDLYEECEHNLATRVGAVDAHYSTPDPPTLYVPVPTDWAVQVAHEARQRNILLHIDMPPYAAFHWGRLPDPPEPRVPAPIDSVPNEEAGWLLSSLVQTRPVDRPSEWMLYMLLPHTVPPVVLAKAMSEVSQQIGTSDELILPEHVKQERYQRIRDELLQRVYPDESLRKQLVDVMPIVGSIALLAGGQQTALWCKAIWREMTERTDIAFWKTETASILLAISQLMLQALTETASKEEPRE